MAQAGAIRNGQLPQVLPRMHPIDYEEAIRHQSSPKEREEDGEVEEEAGINGQKIEDIEDEVQVNLSEETGRENQKRSKEKR
jgi:hypothetical protein